MRKKIEEFYERILEKTKLYWKMKIQVQRCGELENGKRQFFSGDIDGKKTKLELYTEWRELKREFILSYKRK